MSSIVFCTKDKLKFGAKLISDNLYVFGPEWFLFLYFKYWHFRSVKRFWNCNFNFVKVLELHQSMEERNSNNPAPSIHYRYSRLAKRNITTELFGLGGTINDTIRVLIWRFTLVLIKINKIATRSHISPAAIERGVMWVCYPCDILISVKVSPLLCFQN